MTENNVEQYTEVLQNWLAKFERALVDQDAASLRELLIDDIEWRDLVALRPRLASTGWSRRCCDRLSRCSLRGSS